MTIRERVDEAYRIGDRPNVSEGELREDENDLRSIIAETMYSQGYAMGPVGRVLAVLKDEQRAERQRRRLI